ncbi:ATP-binding protein [Streptomyces sp. NA04227]|uniref:ATP-binding protein n=1 Tax=Streptomyces sp. NA04227 TaxID=2742136 RepID=UPI001592A02C|nr:ATP-binding protein [Streptomyces sp. NA04227]
MRFTSTPRGARLARRLVTQRMDEWGHGYDSALNESVTAIAAELVANAVCHGHVPGRDFQLRLTEARGAVRIEVADTRGERMPDEAEESGPPDALAESGRGLFLVTALAARWGVSPRPAGPGKTVWAECDAMSPAEVAVSS